MHRRDFIKLVGYMTVALKTGLLTSGQALSAQMPLKSTLGLHGSIIAASMNPKRHGELSRETHDTVLSSLDLETGQTNFVPIDLHKAHDVLKVKDQYLILPNADSAQLAISNFSGKAEKLTINGGDRYITGHGFYDENENTVILSLTNRDKNSKGEFAVLDADNYKLIEIIESDGYSPHDIQLFDKNTLAVCNYNVKSGGWSKEVKNDESSLSLYDRKTLKLKETIPAYKNAMISHSTVTNDGDLFAIGFREFDDPDIAIRDADYIEDKFASFFAENHSELSSQWPDIAQNLTIARIEKSVKAFGIPLLPMTLSHGALSGLETVQLPHFHHRRAQSICHVDATNTVCMSFPNSNSILLYNATTGVSRSVSGYDLNLEEVRGISQVEGTSYLAVAGIRRGITIIDTASEKQIQHYDVQLGRIIHMHHVV